MTVLCEPWCPVDVVIRWYSRRPERAASLSTLIVAELLCGPRRRQSAERLANAREQRYLVEEHPLLIARAAIVLLLVVWLFLRR
jgi:hypothetical protein